MNKTTTPTTSPIYLKKINGNIYIVIGFIFFSILFCVILKTTINICLEIKPQVAVLIEIPIAVIPVAVSISTQTVDNEYIGTVI